MWSFCIDFDLREVITRGPFVLLFHATNTIGGKNDGTDDETLDACTYEEFKELLIRVALQWRTRGRLLLQDDGKTALYDFECEEEKPVLTPDQLSIKMKGLLMHMDSSQGCKIVAKPNQHFQFQPQPNEPGADLYPESKRGDGDVKSVRGERSYLHPAVRILRTSELDTSGMLPRVGSPPYRRGAPGLHGPGRSPSSGPESPPSGAPRSGLPKGTTKMASLRREVADLLADAE
jgi:hypothetical protein